MRRMVLIRVMSAMFFMLVGAGMSGCAGGGGPAADDDHPGGGFANTGRGFTYGRP
ncbi:MAG: hypothetical protein JWL84_6500 [Rhodospirillales bacterium]|jgi:hypothetical protein|nr:hypothetical protein [Rhodospirillales bacterium]